MAAVSTRNRLAAILLESDTPLLASQIYKLWPGKYRPTTRQIAQMLRQSVVFVPMGTSTTLYASGAGRAKSWTHVDHSLLNPSEEE